MKICIGLLSLLLASTAFGYQATIDTGDIIPAGKYRAIVGPQYVFDGENDGFNLSGRFDVGASKSSNFRGLVGFGQTDFYSGLFYKWVPYPDFENQPAIGIMGGFIYSRESYKHNKEDILNLRVQPLVSKQFETDIGVLTPYGSLPVGVSFVKGSTIYPVQLVGGTEFKPYNWEKVSFFGELGLEVNKSFNYVEVAVSFYFDDTK